ncbi:MAG: cytochrome d ubiquinol oxidase subunit II [Bacteroidales bacterium]|nr:cytochrome d ubiquinol oxidase subunit II [Bacteroidales bacterium]
MFNEISYEFLQQYWWFIVALLAAVLVFLMFVQGLQSLLWQLGKTQTERTIILNISGKKWELGFTTLVTFGGAFFASFPLFYATSFGGAYWVWMIILFTFIVQAVSYEFRSKMNNFLGSKIYELFLIINGFVAPVLIGTAVATFFTGSAFSVDMMNIPRWQHSLQGLEAAFSLTNLSLGLAVLFLVRIMGSQFLIKSTDEKSLLEKCFKQIKIDASLFLPFFLFFVFKIFLNDGFAVDSATGIVSMERFKYLNNLIDMPIVLILFLVGVLLVLYSIYLSVFKNSTKSLWFSGLGTVFTVLSLFFITGLNNTAYYPSTFDLQSSLTIYNSSSSEYTLTAMSYVSLFIPVVIFYVWYVWKAMSKQKVNADSLKNESHTY